MKNKYISPEVEIQKFSFEDILVDGGSDDPEAKLRPSTPEDPAFDGFGVTGGLENN